ncbi:aldo/keto reductase family oxidoreductase [Natronospirillum sp.]|uniref:aldo/keto reductase n=1 Tax=Natronospirillum sp. TaxID=2812955 RepID=UPI0025F7D71B|nr:aldo/keto reductase [Natronospirillum sp.]
MGLGGDWNNSAPGSAEHLQAEAAVEAALEAGITVFDHADIYTRGKAEAVFGDLLKRRPDFRQRMILQSKCGIRFADASGPQRFDFSPEWIRTSVENSLKRLNTDYLDILLLHRPDPLMEPEPVAELFQALQEEGKVLHFGVSNMQQHQMRFLRSHMVSPLVVNQLELSLTALDWINHQVDFNTGRGADTTFPSGTLEFCRQQGIQLQAWGCLSQGRLTGRDVSQEVESVQNTAQLVERLAEQHNTSREAIVLAWLQRHPAGIQPVIGTTNPERIAACAQSSEVTMSREEWYQLFVTARGEPLP